jgi:hypothetical protein
MFGLSKKERREKRLAADSELFGPAIAMFGDLLLRERAGQFTVNGESIRGSHVSPGLGPTLDRHAGFRSDGPTADKAVSTLQIVWDDGRSMTGRLWFAGAGATSGQAGFDQQQTNFIRTYTRCLDSIDAESQGQ